MSEHVADQDVTRLLDRLAGLTGETRRQALVAAITERLAREKLRREPGRNAPDNERLDEQLDEIVRKFSSLPVLDSRSAEEIIGYDENGLP